MINIILKYSITTYVRLIAIMSLVTLCAALYIDYSLGFGGCHLCIYQRIPFGIMIFLGLLTFVKKLPIRHDILFYCVIVCSVTGAVLALYHTGVEMAWWDAADSCKSEVDFAKNLSVEDIMAELRAAPLADCRKPAMRILGFSLAEINFVFNVALTSLLAIRLRTKEQADVNV